MPNNSAQFSPCRLLTAFLSEGGEVDAQRSPYSTHFVRTILVSPQPCKSQSRYSPDVFIALKNEVPLEDHVYEVRPRKDHPGVDLISDALPFGRLVGMPYGTSEYLTILLLG
jgi:hypothetical protein